MAGTRSASRHSAKHSSPTPSQGKGTPGKSSASKRKEVPEKSPTQDSGNTPNAKKQKTLEQTFQSESAPEAAANGNDDSNGQDDSQDNDHSKSPLEDENSNDQELDQSEKTTKDPVIKSARQDETPSSILEKGIIYFFFRGRVGIDEPSSVQDIARSYIVLRPLPHGAKLAEGPISDEGNCRLLALPKKVLPKGGSDKFMVFVEKTKLSFKELKEDFISATDYDTKTAGSRHSPAAAPLGEGVYAITTTGRESHLAYILTIPSEIDQVQQDVGLRQRGSFVLSTKNPKYPSPANASLPQAPEFSQEIIDDFRSLRWMPTKAEHLDYANSQVLMIGENKIEKATEQQPEDEKESKETPLEEIEKLEGEDEIRVKHLDGNDAIFADLHINSGDYPSIQTTW